MKTRGFKIQDFKEDFLYRFALFRISILNLLCALPANRRHVSPLARYKREPESLRPQLMTLGESRELITGYVGYDQPDGGVSFVSNCLGVCLKRHSFPTIFI